MVGRWLLRRGSSFLRELLLRIRFIRLCWRLGVLVRSSRGFINSMRKMISYPKYSPGLSLTKIITYRIMLQRAAKIVISNINKPNKKIITHNSNHPTNPILNRQYRQTHITNLKHLNKNKHKSSPQYHGLPHPKIITKSYEKFTN